MGWCDPDDLRPDYWTAPAKDKEDVMPRSTEILLERLRSAVTDLPSDAQIVRVYATRADRTNGAWSWSIRSGDRFLGIGSQWPVRELLRGGFTVSEPDQTGDRHVDLGS